MKEGGESNCLIFWCLYTNLDGLFGSALWLLLLLWSQQQQEQEEESSSGSRSRARGKRAKSGSFGLTNWVAESVRMGETL